MKALTKVDVKIIKYINYRYLSVINSFQTFGNFLLTRLDKEAPWKRKYRTKDYSVFMNKNNKRQL